MRQINLLPPDLAQRRRARQLTGGVVTGGAILIAILVIAFITQEARLSSEKNKLHSIQQSNVALQQQVATLSQLTQQQQQLRNKQQILTVLTRQEIRWSLLLTEVSLVIPPDDWLTNFTGTTGQAAVGQIQFSGCTLIPADGTHLNVAQFLIQMAKPAEFNPDPGLTLSAKGNAGLCPVQFNASVTLSQQALRANQKGAARQP